MTSCLSRLLLLFVSLISTVHLLNGQAPAPREDGEPFPVNITVDAASGKGVVHPIWRFFGADEPNYATMKDGQKLLAELGELKPGNVYFRTHNLLNTGDGTPSLKWGSTNIYTEDAQGNPVYDWKIVDRILDTYQSRGVKPFLQLGFMPQALSIAPEPYRHEWRPGLPYERIMTGWAYPPKDYNKWAELVYQWVRHCVERYGRTEVDQWYFEVWNEPNGHYWKGTQEEFYKLHDYSIDAVRRALPTARVGGPDVAGSGGKFMDGFLEHVVRGTNYATGKTGTPTDFLAFHAKGRPVFVDGHVRMGISTHLSGIAQGFSKIAAIPELKDKPIVIGESDPEGCAACQGPQNGYRNGTMYSSYTAASFARKLDLADKYKVNLDGALTWAFEFEDQPYFAGFRALATNGVDLPALNVFRMFSKMGGERLRASSSAEVPLDKIVAEGVRTSPDVAAFATRQGSKLCVMVWHYHDDDVAGPDASVSLHIEHFVTPANQANVTHYRIDERHSNAYATWLAMGAPIAPDEKQYAELLESCKLATLSPPELLPLKEGQLKLNFQLPRRGVSLLVFEAKESNIPEGAGKGIFPGRVTWARDPKVTPWDGKTGRWWDQGSIDEGILTRMFSQSLRSLTGADSDAEAWDRLFRHYNKINARGTRSHQPGEGIAVKVNFNNTYNYKDADNNIDQSPQGLRVLLRELTQVARVPEKDITIYDASVGWKPRGIPDRVFIPLHAEFPQVHWVDSQGREGREPPRWIENAISYSSPEVELGSSLPSCVVEASYLINCALLKGHEMGGVTLSAKNHFGSVLYPQKDHGKYVTQMNQEEGSYSALVDLMGAKNLGAKTMLYVVDGLYGMQTNVGDPGDRDHWRRLFKGEWSASLFMSQDPVAIDSVCLDFLTAEFQEELGFSGAKQFPKGAIKHCDNYLREAARGENTRLGAYKPDGRACGSLGVQEHWNNSVDKQYSRNLSKEGRGIELTTVELPAVTGAFISPLLKKLWTSPATLQEPESVLYDARQKCLYVSSMVDRSGFKNGLGFISKLALDGQVMELHWVTGLNAPKGMAQLGDRLFVTNIDEIVEIDVTKGSIVARHSVAGSKDLNDIAIGSDETLYVSDTSLNRLFLFKNGHAEILSENDAIARANGICFDGSRLLVGAKGKLWSLDPVSKTLTVLCEKTGYIDGLQVFDASRFLTSDWAGLVQLLEPGKPAVPLLDTRSLKINAADVLYIRDKHLLLVPTFLNHRLMAYSIEEPATAQSN